MAPTPQQAQMRKSQQLAKSGSGKKKKMGKGSAGVAGSTKASVQRYLASTEPQLRENTKATLLLKGIRTNIGLNALLQELRAVSAPHAKLLSKKNQIVSIGDHDGQRSLEFLTTKNDCALFGIASHNKKRPNRITIGRTFNHQLLDVAELNVLTFKSMKDYGGTVPKKRIGSKPLLLFVGDIWQQREPYRNLQNLLIDFYRGDVVDRLVLSGIDHVIVFTAAATTVGAPTGGNNSKGPNNNDNVLIHQRTYFCKLKKNVADASSSVPVPYLEPCGPDLDFKLGRTEWCDSKELYWEARKQPQQLKSRKKKNQTTNLFGETMGRLHVTKQNLESSTYGRKSKALRRAEQTAKQEDRDAIEQELQREGVDLEQEHSQTSGVR